MTRDEWLASADPAAMLAHLEEAAVALDSPFPSDRKLRLFACACCRAVWPLLADERSRRAVEVAERFADGLATEQERSAALHDRAGKSSGPDDPWLCCADTALYAAEYVGYDTPIIPLAIQAALLRCVAGDPFAPVVTCLGDEAYPPDPECRCAILPWLTPTVLALARHVYAERDFAALPVLADALEDGGCTEERLLRHLRGFVRCVYCLDYSGDSVKNEWCTYCGLERWLPEWWYRTPSPSPPLRVRGDWAVDLILGKE